MADGFIKDTFDVNILIGCYLDHNPDVEMRVGQKTRKMCLFWTLSDTDYDDEVSTNIIFHNYSVALSIKNNMPTMS